MKIYVSAASRGGNGSKDYPLTSIAEAAKLAKPGDEVIVAPGIYREYVDPVNAGTEENRITYRSEVKYGAVISGAEEVKTWKPYSGDTYVARIPNSLFGAYNPYKVEVTGDWYTPVGVTHTGEVYLNDAAMYETDTLEETLNPTVWNISWDPEGSLYKWYTEQDEEKDETILYANFRGKNPNEECVEINVRRNCFYPSVEGIGYITLSGFTVTKAATQWAPPTAYQEGMIGPHWSKGWIIEDCDVSHSKCSGISLGKYLQPNNENKWMYKRLKTGTQTERDAICQAQREGWTKELVGSHIVRRCNIHDCGQTGIVGHLGCVFSIIEDNDIHHINFRHKVNGAEIAGIKFHAAIDVIIRRNHFHNCGRGLWLDWQAQGTRVSRNLFDHNTPPMPNPGNSGYYLAEDLFVEVSHGPTLMDNNIFLSPIAGHFSTQGIALVHNLVAGSFVMVGAGVDNGGQKFATPRYTPYHMPHRTEIDGFMTILHGDARFYNNVFIQPDGPQWMADMFKEMAERFKARGREGFEYLMTTQVGTIPYNGYPTAEEYFAPFYEEDYRISGGRDKYYDHLPVYSGGNVFFNGALPYDKEKDFYEDKENKVTLELIEEDGKFRLSTNYFEFMPDRANQLITTDVLGEAFEPEEKFENPDGTPIFFNEDFFGQHRAVNPVSGPFESAQDTGAILF